MKSKPILSLTISLMLLAANAGGIWAQANGAEPSSTPLTAPVARLLGDGKMMAGAGTEPSLRVVESSERGVVLELVTPDYELQPLAEGCLRLSVEGYGATDRSGWPELPLRGTMVGIPPQAEVALRVLERESVVRRVGRNLCPAAQPIVEVDAEGRLQYLGEERVRDERAYSMLGGGYYPLAAVELAETAYIRSQRVAQVRFQPFHYNPVTGELRHDRRIRVLVDFFPEERIPASLGTFIDEGSFEPILRYALLNYEQARNWRERPTPTYSPQTVWPPHEGTWYKVSVDQDGIYQMDTAYLQAAGLPVDEIDPRTIQMYNMGEEIAILVEGEADGSFDAGDAVVFYGEKMDTRYTDVNVYWLTWGHADGLRMEERDGRPGENAPTPSAFPTAQRAERNLVYLSRWPAPDGDNWYWEMVFAVAATTRVYTTELAYPASGPLNATISGIFWGLRNQNNQSHHTRVYLNGFLVDDAIWPSESMYIFDQAIPQSYLVEGTNVVSVQLPFDMGIPYEFIYVNRFDITYHRLYTAENDLLFFTQVDPGAWAYQIGGFSTAGIESLDISDPAHPIRVRNAVIEAHGGSFSIAFGDAITQERRYLASARRQVPVGIDLFQTANLASPSRGADYLVITHGDFYTSLLPLTAYRNSQGLRTTIVDVADIYEEFGYGVFDPQAIHDFLAYTYANWTPPSPLYVLLVGDGNYDFKNYEGKGEPIYIPPYLDDVDPWLIETASDNRYVTVYGNDTLPDMHIGRLPVKGAAEAAAMVGKILNYEQNPPAGNWTGRVLFVADNADSAGNFAQISDNVISSSLPAPYVPDRVYLGVTHPYQNPSVIAHQAVIDAINEGRLLVNYVGHAGFLLWAMEYLFKAEDVPNLINGGRLPLMVPMTCYDGYFIVPSAPNQMDYSSVGETVVRAPNGGAIGSFSPSGLGVATGHDYLNRGLFQALFTNGIVQLGPATTAAKLYLYTNTSAYRDLLDTYMLFGDPALALNVLKTDVEIAMAVAPQAPVRPGNRVTYTITYNNSGPATAFRVAISDPLPDVLLDPQVTSSGAAITPTGYLAWNVANLPAGAGGVITVSATVSTAFHGTFTNTVTIASTAVETDTANNASALATRVIAPDLTIAKAGPATALPGATIYYTLTFANDGDALAEGVVIQDLLPAPVVSATFLSSGAVVTAQEGTRFIWDAGDLLPGEGGVITIAAVLDPSFSGPLTNTATIANSAIEPRQANNSAVQVTHVPYRAYLPLLMRRIKQ